MNLILLESQDFVEADVVRLSGRRAEHIKSVHRASIGQVLRVGVIDGAIGHGEICAMDGDKVDLRVSLTEQPPKSVPIVLAVAMSRPPTLQKILSSAASLGIKHVVFFHSRRVEKSYWQSHAVQAAAMREHLLLGLEQACDSQVPTVELLPRFLPFVEDHLPRLRHEHGLVYFADPDATTHIYDAAPAPSVVVLGPEGGFVPYEVDKLRAAGCTAISLGPRILRVEVAVTACLAVLGGLR